MARRLTDEQKQELYLETQAERAREHGGVWIDDLNPRQRGDPELKDPRDLRVRAFVYAAGTLWLTYATVRPRDDGTTAVSAISIEAALPRDAVVTVRLLQRFPVGLLARRALEQAERENELDVWAAAYGRPAVPPAEAAARVVEEAERLGVRWAPPRGNRGTPRAFYDALALEVVALGREGATVVPEMVNRRGRDASTIKRWIRDARDVGALAPRGWKLGPAHPATTTSKEEQ